MRKASLLLIIGDIIAFIGFILYCFDVHIVYVYTFLGIGLFLMIIALWYLIRSK